MYILQHSPPPRQCTDSLSFPIIFEPIRQFVGYKNPGERVLHGGYERCTLLDKPIKKHYTTNRKGAGRMVSFLRLR